MGTYAMEGHIDGLKGAYLLGLTLALQKYDKSRGASFLAFIEFYINTAIQDYVRTMRTGYTIQSRDEDAMLRKVMAIFAEHDYCTDDETIGMIAREINRKPETVRELPQAGMRNVGSADFSRQYSDDGEEGTQDVLVTFSTDPYYMLLNRELEEALLTAFEDLNYRERAIVSEYLGFCPKCFCDYQLVADDSGSKVKQQIKPKAFVDIAYDHGLAFPSSADRIYRQTLEKMSKAIREKTA